MSNKSTLVEDLRKIFLDQQKKREVAIQEMVARTMAEIEDGLRAAAADRRRSIFFYIPREADILRAVCSRLKDSGLQYSVDDDDYKYITLTVWW